MARLRFALALATALVLVSESEGCTVIGVGRKASLDGSVMVAHTDDSGGMGDPRLVRVPARDWPLNSTRNVLLSIADFPRAIAPERADEYATASRAHAELPWATPLGSIPQVPHTYAYWDIDYGLGNEHALVMAETTCSGRLKGAPIGYNGTAMFGIEELSKVALERCKTASCAVSLMGALAEEHGFYGGNGHLGKLDPWPGTMPGGEAEALAIGDAEGELWVFHILPGPGGPGRGAVWAAQRMAEDQVTVIANSFILRELDLADPTTSRASKDIVAVATELDFFDPDLGAPFDFTAAFGGNVNTVDPTGRKQLVGRFYAGRRIWRVFDLLAPGLSLDPDIGYFQERQTYPMGVAPEKLLSVRGFFAILRDHYEGTPFDMTVGPAAGPFGSPNRWGPGAGERDVPGGWERAISMHRSLFSFVAQARPDKPSPLQGLVWIGEDSPHATCFVPFFLAQSSLPTSYTTGTMGIYSSTSAWWAANVIKTFMDLHYTQTSADVSAAANECEDAGEAVVERAEVAALAIVGSAPHRQLASRKASAQRNAVLKKSQPTDSEFVHTSPHSDPHDAAEAAGSVTSAHATWVVDTWHTLFGTLMVKYKNGYNNTIVAEGISRESGIGYPAWWLTMVGYGEWAERVLRRSDEADERRAAGQPVAKPEPGAADVTPIAPPLKGEKGHRLFSLMQSVGMAVGAVLGALLFFALGVVGGHRLDRITRHPHLTGADQVQLHTNNA